jgi:hypothetical protein
MAHYAYLDDNNIVVDVIVGKDETDTTHDWEIYYAKGTSYTVKRTSYNGKIRYNYAGIGYTYDPIDDAFIPPMPECGHEELLLNDLKRWECSNDEHKATFIEVSDSA